MDNNSKEQKNRTLTQKKLQTLMDEYSNDLFFFVRGIVKNNEIAEELVSNVFVKLWKKKDSFSTIENIKSYFFILARNEAISFIRKKENLNIVQLEEVSDYFSAPLENNDGEDFDQQMVAKINEAIETLPAKCKIAFSLAKISGLKYKEIAEVMEISPNTVKNHIVYALDKICSYVGVLKNGESKASDIYFFIFRKKSKNFSSPFF